MDISTEAILAGFSGLTTALVVLYRNQVKSQSRCEANEVRMAKKIDELDRFQRTEMAELAERAATLAATSMPLLDRAMRVLRRHEQDHTPTDDGLRVKHPSGDTTAIVRVHK